MIDYQEPTARSYLNCCFIESLILEYRSAQRVDGVKKINLNLYEYNYVNSSRSNLNTINLAYQNI